MGEERVELAGATATKLPTAEGCSDSKAAAVEKEGQVDKFANAKEWQGKLAEGGYEAKQKIPCVLRLLQGVGRLMSRLSQLDEESGVSLFTIYSSIFKEGGGGGGGGSSNNLASLPDK